MNIALGTGMLPGYISLGSTNKMTSPELCIKKSFLREIWEKIKNHFFPNGRDQAIKYLEELFSAGEKMTIQRIEEIFFELQDLVAPTFKKNFTHHDYNGKDILAFSIEGNDIFSIERTETECSYKLMGTDEVQRLNFDALIQIKSDPYIKMRVTDYQHNNDMDFAAPQKVSFYWQKTRIVIDLNSVNNIMISEKEAGALPIWKEQERTTYISSLINKEIDKIFTSPNSKVMSPSNDERNNIFNAMFDSLALENIKKDSKAVQSTIKQRVATVLTLGTTEYLKFKRELMEKMIDYDQNTFQKIEREITDVISDIFYTCIFNEDIKSVQETLEEKSAVYSCTPRTYPSL